MVDVIELCNSVTELYLALYALQCQRRDIIVISVISLIRFLIRYVCV